MREHSDRFRRNSHRECWDMLPWLVNDTLSDAQRQRLEGHLAECADCRREASEQRLLREHLRQEHSVLYAPQASLQKLLQRIDEADPLPITEGASRRGIAGSRAMKLLVATIVVGAVSFVAMNGVNSWRSQEQRSAPSYSTLTSKPAVVASVPGARVVFAPTMSLAQLSELLGAMHAQVVTGPSEAGVYTLVFTSTPSTSNQLTSSQVTSNQAATKRDTSEAVVDAAVQELRRNPHVLFAEVVDATEDRTGR